MRTASVAVLAWLAVLAAGPAAAQGSGSCTFTYNPYSKKIETRCQGIPAAPLPAEQRIGLATGKLKSCVVEVVRVDAKQVKAQPPVCQ